MDPNESERLSPHFLRSEFACKCGCGFATVDPVLIEQLELLRMALGRPIVIDDACRCEIHNKKVGGAAESQHMLGRAADIRVGTYTPRSIYAFATQIGCAFGGYGVPATNQPGDFIHVDVRKTLPLQTRWSYDASGKEIPWAF